MSLRPPSGRRSRNMVGHFASGAMRGSRLRGLLLSVTSRGLCRSDIPMGAVTLRTASGATLGRLAVLVRGVPRSRVRFAATRHRGPQKRAVERCDLNCRPQVEQAIFMTRLSAPGFPSWVFVHWYHSGPCAFNVGALALQGPEWYYLNSHDRQNVRRDQAQSPAAQAPA
jgi:hypothetical protein